MSGANFIPAQTGLARVWIIEGRARPDHLPSYESCLMMEGISQDFGDVTKIEVPAPDRYNKFIEIGEISGEVGRVTTTLSGRYALDITSKLARLARQQCRSDIQLHFGECEDPFEFGVYKKALILESAKNTNYSTDTLSSLSSSDRAEINENSDISASLFYEVVPMTFAQRAGDIVTLEVVDVIDGSYLSCGDCEDEDNGCDKIFAVTLQAGGSPGTPPDVVYSVDKGLTWYAHDIDTLLTTEDASGVARISANLVVVSNDSNSLHYAPVADFKAGGVAVSDPVFTEVTTGFVVGGEPNDIWSVGNKAFICGDGGYVYSTEDPTSGATVLDAGVATPQNLNAIHALSSTFAVAVGDAGAVIYTENGETFSATTSTPVAPGLVNLYCVWAKTSSEWFVGTSDGRVFYTLDKGVTWVESTFPGSGTGRVDDIAFASDSVVRFAHSTTAPLGRIIESIGGGHPNTWKVLPLGSSSLPANDRINAIALCPDDVNFMCAVGLADDAADGFVVVGQG